MKTLKTIFKYLFQRDKIKSPRVINAKTVNFLLQGHLRHLLSNFGMVKQHILEEASWRHEQVKKNNPKCIELGECEFCGCAINELLISSAKCEHGCFPEMRTESEWNNFKLNNNINIENDNN